MKTKNIIILESNNTVLQQLKDLLQDTCDYQLTYVGDDGEEGIQRMMAEKPDLIITGMFLKGVDGSSVIRSAKKMWPSAKILALGIANDDLIESALSLGANYYLIKPFSIESARERIEELLSQATKSEGKEYVAKRKKSVTIDEKISEIFISIGVPPHIKGYTYLREAIKLTVEKPHMINGVTKELYPTVAKKFETSPSKVERAIRHAIEVAWNRARIDAINAVFGARVYLGTEKPTNSEFIALVADKLILESML